MNLERKIPSVDRERLFNPLKALALVADVDTAAAGEAERSWLAFRVGRVVLCASVLDVEGIITPPMLTTFPLMPGHVLGTFEFRDHAATAVSLRRKLNIQYGEDNARGPLIVARIGDDQDMFAFWVDEVKDVFDGEGIEWSPMPDMLNDCTFDQYAIRKGELILHTHFEALLNAKNIQAVEQWAASLPAQDDEKTVSAPFGETAISSSGASVSTNESSANVAGIPALDVQNTASETPDALSVERHANAAQDAKQASLSPSAPVVEKREDEIDVAHLDRAVDAGNLQRRIAAAETGVRSPAVKPHVTHPVPPVRTVTAPARATQAAWTAAHENPHDVASVVSRHAVADEYASRHGDASANSGIENREVEWRDERIEPPGISQWAEERTNAGWWIGATSAVAILVVAALLLWPDSKNDARSDRAGLVVEDKKTGGEKSRPASESVSLAPVEKSSSAVSVQSKPSSELTAESTRLVTVKTDDFTLTVERPKAEQKSEPKSVSAQKSASAAVNSQSSPPVSENVSVHVVVRGDTLWDIAKKYLGNPYRYPELARVSDIRNPNLIRPGDIVRIEKNRRK